ncbi:MAG TPA: efflux RND transporter periplasmic adaptor subunit [Bryobacteraceae bacterium]|nr:efflux RND transporter periplasmic adaptor subunit [Bryobacteraceae bacterium]
MKTLTDVPLRAWLAASLILILAGCHAAGSPEKGVEAEKHEHDPLEIQVNAELMKQIRIGEPTFAQVSGTLRVAARVEADETRMARVSAPVTGRITDLDVYEGQMVKRGQVLATLHSTELSSSQFAFLRASSQQRLAQQAAGRAKQLLEAGVIGEAEVQRREAELHQATAELSSARDELKVLGMPEEAIAKLEADRTVNSLSEIVSSIDGRVLERKVTIGQVVQPAETIFVVADLSKVWLVADVPEQSATGIQVGKSVNAEIPALPGELISGTLSFVSPIVSPETRTVRARMDLPNPELHFKPAMLATMTLVDGAERQRIIPRTAVVREGNEDHVFVQTGPSAFVLRRVTLGDDFRDARVVVDGIHPGEKIVLDGAFHLNNERKQRAVQGE